eukprot:CAMPEP_0198231140 /NCGR_PEP_ID=MMETSP1445-20131203/115042_1 /TAXON_ID=36898 /ORGANISM="Pyramimonas sp., Strain CCMP2087" /LENGTH=304 /DNA_ID=CAMNT_0043911733 /DNA_START=711 /DNA_END=1628 /DNA_ORIENTATION=+
MLHLPSLDLKFDVATSSSSANSKKALIKRVTPAATRSKLSKDGLVVQSKDLLVQSQSSRTRKLSEKLLHHLALSATATPSLLRDLLPLLANEDTVEATLLAARTLRANFSVDGAELSTNELVSSAELALALLKSPHFEVQHEGCELLVELCNFKGGRHVVAVRLLSTFTPALANHLANLTAHVVDILFAKSPSGSTIQMRRCMLPPEYQRHSLAAKLLARLTMDFCEDPITRDVVVQESTLLGLLMLMADKDSCNARIHGLSALLSLLEHAPEVKELIRHRMGELFLAELTSRGEHFFNDGTLA